MTIDKDKIKNELTIEQIESLTAELGAEPIRKNNILICKTICHNSKEELSNASHKLYYYDNTHLFRCYTECDDTFDIFELIIKIKKIQGEEWNLYNAISFIINYFSLDFELEENNKNSSLADWKILKKYEDLSNKNNEEKKNNVKLKIFDSNILKNFPRPRYLNWEREGISKQVCDHRGICYDPISDGIIIPHYNINGELIGIRERTLIKEEEINGKYKPAIINGVMYNHPLGYNLYNLNFSKKNVKALKKVFIFESEKSCLKYATFFGEDQDLSVAICGSNLISYQVKLLLSLGVGEIIIALDRQYKEIGDKEWQGWVKKLYTIHDKYGRYVQVSYLFDKEHILNYKDSPIDNGKEKFLYLFDKRIII